MINLRTTPKGFTLVEVLVALVITSLLISILMGLLFYVYRAQTSLRAEIVEREFDLRTRDWFSETLSGCLPAAGMSGNEFTGTRDEINCDTLTPLRPQRIPAPQRITLAIRRNSNNQNELTYRQQGDNTSNSTPLILLPFGEAQFIYYDLHGEEKNEWPASSNNAETLPRRIRLVVKQSSKVVFDWLATPRADPWLEPVMPNPLGIEIPR